MSSRLARLHISSGRAGATPGSLALQVRRSGNVTVPTGANTSANNLPITVGTWHTYRLVVSGAGPVTISAYLDDATTCSPQKFPPGRSAGAAVLAATSR